MDIAVEKRETFAWDSVHLLLFLRLFLQSFHVLLTNDHDTIWSALFVLYVTPKNSCRDI